nr:MAG TPA: SAP domain [Caudoviricetes sp.]
MKGHLDAKELESYKKEDLQDLARKLGVSDEGTKAEIAARCAAVEVDVPDESELTDEKKAAAEQAAKEAAEKEAAEKAEAEQAAKEAAEKEAAEKAAAEQAAKEAADKAAGKVKVEVTKRYLDKQLKQIKDAGETFTVDKTRADELVAAKVAKIKE